MKCEFKKFNCTYINSLSMLGMLLPVFLVLIMFLIKKDDFIASGSYNWEMFNSQLSTFFVFLVGPIITSFIAVFSVFYELEQKTFKNMLTSPHRRFTIILTKIIYVSIFVILQYVLVAAINITCASLLGFNFTFEEARSYSLSLIYAGMSTVLLVPMMMFLALLFKSFIPALVIAVAGTISNILVLNWEYSYFSPWAVPADIFAISGSKLTMPIYYPLTSFAVYFVVFAVLTILYFQYADQKE